jgi:hypothetical protein
MRDAAPDSERHLGLDAAFLVKERTREGRALAIRCSAYQVDGITNEAGKHAESGEFFRMGSNGAQRYDCVMPEHKEMRRIVRVLQATDTRLKALPRIIRTALRRSVALQLDALTRTKRHVEVVA